MSLATVLGDLEAEFGWPPDAWRRLTWREFTARVEELGRRRTEEERARQQAERRAENQRLSSEFFRSFGMKR